MDLTLSAQRDERRANYVFLRGLSVFLYPYLAFVIRVSPKVSSEVLPPFDHYSFRARLQPALFTLLPWGLALFAWAGEKRPWMGLIWSVLGTAGATYFLSIAARNQGKKIEPTLWLAWGGAPTTQMLRHRGPANPLHRERWHKFLAKALATRFPTPAEESMEQRAADHVYEAAAKYLIGKTRDSRKYPLLYKENVSYGFCRNLYAMRPTGIFIAVSGIATSAGAAVLGITRDAQVLGIACATVSGIILLAWLTRVTESWVKVPAFAYAERLFETIDALARNRSASTASQNQ